MKKIDLGQTITILANLGVVAGIFFLAVEVRQNQAALEDGNAMNLIEVQNIAQEHFSRFRTMILENDELFRVWQRGMTGAELTDLEQAKFDELCSEQMFRLATAHRTYFSLEPASEYRSSVAVVNRNIAKSRNYARCWERNRSALDSPDNFNFVEMVEDFSD